MSNPFLAADGHVLADDMEKDREAKEYGHALAAQVNPFLVRGVPIMSPGLRFAYGIDGHLIGPMLVSDMEVGDLVSADNTPVITVNGQPHKRIDPLSVTAAEGSFVCRCGARSHV
jgi:hypothetical protein